MIVSFVVTRVPHVTQCRRRHTVPSVRPRTAFVRNVPPQGQTMVPASRPT